MFQKSRFLKHQVKLIPSAFKSTVRLRPAEIETMSVQSKTSNKPYILDPRFTTDPSVFKPPVWKSPAEIAVAFLIQSLGFALNTLNSSALLCRSSRKHHIDHIHYHHIQCLQQPQPFHLPSNQRYAIDLRKYSSHSCLPNIRVSLHFLYMGHSLYKK